MTLDDLEWPLCTPLHYMPVFQKLSCFPFLQARSHFYATYCFAHSLLYNLLLTVNDISLLVSNAFSALTLLVGRQEGHPGYD